MLKNNGTIVYMVTDLAADIPFMVTTAPGQTVTPILYTTYQYPVMMYHTQCSDPIPHDIMQCLLTNILSTSNNTYHQRYSDY